MRGQNKQHVKLQWLLPEEYKYYVYIQDFSRCAVHCSLYHCHHMGYMRVVRRWEAMHTVFAWSIAPICCACK